MDVMKSSSDVYTIKNLNNNITCDIPALDKLVLSVSIFSVSQPNFVNTHKFAKTSN